MMTPKPFPLLQSGDRLLTKRIKGPYKFFSEAIAWKLNSEFSHVVPVFDEFNCLNIIWPEPEWADNRHFFTGDFRVLVLRPALPLTDKQTVRWRRAVIEVRKKKYDLKSFAGFASNKDTQNPRQVNCSEGTLYCDRAMGLLMRPDTARLISPQSYKNFADAGLFNIIYEG